MCLQSESGGSLVKFEIGSANWSAGPKVYPVLRGHHPVEWVKISNLKRNPLDTYAYLEIFFVYVSYLNIRTLYPDIIF